MSQYHTYFSSLYHQEICLHEVTLSRCLLLWIRLDQLMTDFCISAKYDDGVARTLHNTSQTLYLKTQQDIYQKYTNAGKLLSSYVLYPHVIFLFLFYSQTRKLALVLIKKNFFYLNMEKSKFKTTDMTGSAALGM